VSQTGLLLFSTTSRMAGNFYDVMSAVTILVLADTHFARHTQQLDPAITSYFDSVDYIVHAGDYTTENLVETLEVTGKFVGVYGNMDPLAVRDMVPEINSIRLDSMDLLIGIVHGWGAPDDLIQRIHPLCATKRFDIVLFGHTHNKQEEQFDGITYFNPGSPVDKMFAKENSFLLLTIASKDDVHAEFVTL